MASYSDEKAPTSSFFQEDLEICTLNATWHQGNTAGHSANKHLDDKLAFEFEASCF